MLFGLGVWAYISKNGECEGKVRFGSQPKKNFYKRRSENRAHTSEVCLQTISSTLIDLADKVLPFDPPDHPDNNRLRWQDPTDVDRTLIISWVCSARDLFLRPASCEFNHLWHRCVKLISCMASGHAVKKKKSACGCVSAFFCRASSAPALPWKSRSSIDRSTLKRGETQQPASSR